MTDAREQVLQRVRSALADRSQGEHSPPVSRPANASARLGSSANREQLVEKLKSELARLRASVYSAADMTSALGIVGDLAKKYGATSVVAWSSLRRLLSPRLPGDSSFQFDEGSSDGSEFRRAASDAVIGLTEVDYAIAETGSLVVLSGSGRARTASLLPRIHVALVRVEQILPGLDELFVQLDAANETPSAVTFITGPSRTADIELTLVVGVHGPQELHVILVGQ